MIMEKEYAYALLQAARNGMSSKESVSGLVRTLRSHGHMNLLPRISRALSEEERRLLRSDGAVLTVAAESEADAARSAAAGYAGSHQVRIATDERLIGGWVLTTPDTRVDASFKKQLVALYQAITN
jgi:F0F1-type ATP synthase delta subunit